MLNYYTLPDPTTAGADFLEGVFVYTWRLAAATFGPVDALDTGDGWVDTNPGTIVQYKSNTGTISNDPGKLICLTGRVYTPSGVPYTHLAE
jgi:hypothetical protein